MSGDRQSRDFKARVKRAYRCIDKRGLRYPYHKFEGADHCVRCGSPRDDDPKTWPELVADALDRQERGPR